MSKKILLVEDDRDIVNLVKHYLEKEGFRVIDASDGAKGLEKLQSMKK